MATDDNVYCKNEYGVYCLVLIEDDIASEVITMEKRPVKDVVRKSLMDIFLFNLFCIEHSELDKLISSQERESIYF